MFSVLIPCVRKGYLVSQLDFLSHQTFKGFKVVVLDNCYEYHLKLLKSLVFPFEFYHFPAVYNRLISKTFDSSIKNNLALLSPTYQFVFISDIDFPFPNFAEKVYNYIMLGKDYSVGVISGGFFKFNSVSLDLTSMQEGTLPFGLVFNKRTFFYLFNGFDEATTYAYPNELEIFVRIRNSQIKTEEISGVLGRVSKSVTTEQIYNKVPCGRCLGIFCPGKLGQDISYRSFSTAFNDVDPEVVEQFIYFDKQIESWVFECPNCGFCGVIDRGEYLAYLTRSGRIDAPVGLFGGKCGRDFSSIYGTVCSKFRNMEDIYSFLPTTY